MNRKTISALAAASLGLATPATAAELSCSGIEWPQGLIPYDVFMVYFDRDSAAITPQTAATLDNVAQVYRPLSHCLLMVAAHTDRVGSAAHNLTLSQRRAGAIVAHLRRLGVLAEARIEPYGETRPLVETEDGVEERQNRRAEIVIAPRDFPAPRE